MKVHEFISGLKGGTIRLPEFQRGYVWGRSKSVDLMDSLYREYPIGSVTIWHTDQGEQLIIDGQQRLSSIFACYTDDIPDIHINSEKKPFTGMYFNLDTEKFQFASQRVRSRDYMWVKISDILSAPNSNKAKAWRSQIKNSPKYDEDRQNDYEDCITNIRRIRDIDIPILPVAADRTSRDVMDMFERMNTKCTPVRRWEIEMARMSIKWPEAKGRIVAEAQRHQDTIVGKRMNEEAIIRTMTAVHSGRYTRDGLEAARDDELRQAFQETQKSHQAIIDSLVKCLGLYDIQAVPNLSTFPAIATFLKKHNGRFPTVSDEAKALAYFILSGRGVFHGSTDSHIDGDVKEAAEQSCPWDAIYKNAEQKVGTLEVAPGHFEISRQRQSRAFSLVHILQMDEKVCDWHTGLPIRSYPPDELEQHHIFPRTHLQVKGVEASNSHPPLQSATIPPHRTKILTSRHKPKPIRPKTRSPEKRPS